MTIPDRSWRHWLIGIFGVGVLVAGAGGCQSEGSGPDGGDAGTGNTSGGASNGGVSAGRPSTGGASGGAGGQGSCDAGSEYLVPGCAFQGAPFEAGCYQRCTSASDSSCPQGQSCQETTINPCVCPVDQACCAACGMSAWVCLPTAAGCQITAQETAILSGRNSFGMCLGQCVFDVTLLPSAAGVPGCDRARLEVSERGGAPLVRTNTGVLTPEAHALARSLAAALSGVSLQDGYGCPDCADGGASQITLSRAGTITSHLYEYSNPPAALVGADELVQSILSGLRACQSNQHVVVDSNCTP